MEFTAKQNITGTTLIDHNIRNKLGLTCDEYAIADYIHRNPLGNLNDISVNLGFINTCTTHISSLLNKGILKGNMLETIYLSDRWKECFDTSLEFDEFWALYRKWGNKADAKKKYEKCRKIAFKEQIFKGVNAYLHFKGDTEQQYIMKAETWLNPEKRHWEDEYQQSEPAQPIHIRPKK